MTPGYSVVRRRKYRDASGAATARASADQASDASMGCCIDQAAIDADGFGFCHNSRTAAVTALTAFQSATARSQPAMIASGPALVLQPTASPVTAIWGSLLDDLQDQMLAHRKIFLMHERNQAALDKLHRKDHAAEHDDIQERLRQALADPALSLRDRVRMACSLGAVLGALFIAGDVFDNVPGAELGSLVRDVVADHNA